MDTQAFDSFARSDRQLPAVHACRVEPPGGHDAADGLTAPSAIELSQIRSVDRQWLVKRLGALDATTMHRVDDALRISLTLPLHIVTQLCLHNRNL